MKDNKPTKRCIVLHVEITPQEETFVIMKEDKPTKKMKHEEWSEEEDVTASNFCNYERR